jgi:two-component system response regulator AlgR
MLIVDDERWRAARLRTLLGECPSLAAGGRRGANAAAGDGAARACQPSTWCCWTSTCRGRRPGAGAAALRGLPHPPAVVFVTAHAEHAVQAFELEAVDYLTKPVRLERLQLALQKVERAVQSRASRQPPHGTAGVR